MAFTQLIANASVNDLYKGIENVLDRRYLFWNLLRSKAESRLGRGGPRFQWAPLTEDVIVEAYNPGDVGDFPTYRTASKAVIPARELTAKKNLLRTETDILRDENAVAAYMRDAGKLVAEAMAAELNKQALANDGGSGADDNGTGLNGLPSLFSGTYNDTAITGTPNDTYATISTALTTFTSDTSDRAYGAWSPQLIDATASDWTGSTDNWATHALRATREVIDRIETRGYSADDLVMMVNQTDFSAMKNLMDSSYGRFDYGQADPEMAKLGFHNNFRYNGVLVIHDNAVPTGKAFIVNLAHACLWSPADQLLTTYPVTFDPRTKGDLLMVGFHGNMIWKAPPAMGQIITT